MLDYILDTLSLLWEAPYRLVMLVATIGIFYCAAMMIVGIPTSIWESIAKKKVNEDIQNKVIIAVTILLIISVIIFDAYQKTH